MEQKFALPLAFPALLLQATPLCFNQKEQLLEINGSKIYFDESRLSITVSEALTQILNLEYVEAQNEPIDRRNQFVLASEWRYDDSLSLPGPPIFKNVVVSAGRCCICFRKADRTLFLATSGLCKAGFDQQVQLDEPIYQVIILQDDCKRLAVALTATMFPEGYYGVRSDTVNGHLVLLTLPPKEDRAADAISVSTEKQASALSDYQPCSQGKDVCAKTPEISTVQHRDAEAAVQRSSSDTEKTEILFLRFLDELRGECRPAVLSEIRRLLCVFKGSNIEE